MNDNDTYTLTLDDDITINLDSISDNTGTYSLDSTLSLGDITTSISPSVSTITIDTGTTGTIYNVLDTFIDPEEVDRMCEEYPALYKVWRNFKSVYDMTLQDWKGNNEEKNN
jgi:hypothetical protein